MTNEEKQTEILKLKKELNAVIIAHNYQIPEIQDISDFLGDSLELSKKVTKLNNKNIFFCGVKFMAETAKILSPEKHIYIPEIEAGCRMADMVSAKSLREFKKKYPGAKTVCYVNTTAETKTECDICCTSANAVDIVNSLDANTILFVPDSNLASYVQTKTLKKIIPYPGYCYVHNLIKKDDVEMARVLHPDAIVIVHPEAKLEASLAADYVLSTGGMVKIAKETNKKEIVVGTEEGMIYRLQKENPDKKFYPLKDKLICQGMKAITLDNLLESLKELKYEIKLPEEIIKNAYKPIQRMVEL